MMGHDWQAARRLLVVRLGGMGDLLMTGPAIRALKAAAVGRNVTALVSPPGAAVARLLPGVDDVIVYRAPWMRGVDADAAMDHAVIEQLRTRRFDAAVIFTVFGQSPLPAALLCHLAQIPRRAAHCRENPYALLTTWVIEKEPEDEIRHDAERQLGLVAELGASAGDDKLAISLPESARAWGARHRAEGRPTIVLHPGASASSRRYPEESYATVLRLLEHELDAACVLAGTDDERELLLRIRQTARSDATVVCGTSLAELAGLQMSADVVVTNNTGPAHLATAVGTPVVVLYALTNPQQAPWMAASRVLSADVPCRNCFKSVCASGHHRCLRDVSPRQVVDAATELLLDGSGLARRALC